MHLHAECKAHWAELGCATETTCSLPDYHVGVYLGKHLEDLPVDVIRATGIHLILEIRLNWGVLLGSEEKARSIAASGQGGPARHGDRGDTGQSIRGPFLSTPFPHSVPTHLLNIVLAPALLCLGPSLASYWEALAAILP